MRLIIFTALFILCGGSCLAQKGTLTFTFTPADARGKVVSGDYSSLIKGVYPSNDYSAYWFINPHTGLHHLVVTLNNKAGLDASFLSTNIELNSSQNDFEFWDHPHPNSDSNFVALDKALYVISAPLEYDQPEYGGTNNHNKPMQVHITTFSNSEIEFTISGNAEYGTKEGDGKFLGYGNIQLQGHFYRQGAYEKSPVYPGCNCDPTIYAERYDLDEEGDVRTASECESITLNKIFNASQKALAPVYNGAFSGTGKAPQGTVMLRAHNHIEVPPTVPARAEWPFAYNYKLTISRGNTTPFLHNYDGYGIEMDEMPDDSKMNAVQAQGEASKNNVMEGFQSMGMKEKQARIDSLAKLFTDKKISFQQYSDGIQKIMAPANAIMDATIKKGNEDAANGPDFKKMNMESMMHIVLNFNPAADYFIALDNKVKQGDVQVLHTVAGAAYVVRAPAVKDDDGEWRGNECVVLLGKFKQPVVGNHDSYYTHAVSMFPVYPAGGNRLLIYNIVVRMTGGPDQIEKALATIDFSALADLIAKQ